jgi:hypothetical protein
MYLLAAVAATASVPLFAASGQSDSSAKMICKYAKVTGSRLGRERVCMRKGEWDLAEEETRKATDKATTPQGGTPPTN